MKANKNNLNPNESYEKINKVINAWPDWKKKAYNEMFAISVHAEKIPVDIA